MSTPKHLTAAAAAGAALLALGGPVAGASAPPDSEFTFLQTDAIDTMVADAEGASANCAALEAVGGILFMIGLSNMASDETETTELGSHPMELLVAFYAPSLVPLLERATPPSDPAWAEAIELIGGELRATIAELHDLGLSDDDIVALQTDPMAETPTEESEAPEATMPAQYEALFDHDFESLTFLDPDGALAESEATGFETLWGDECPETAAMFSVDMEPVDVEMDFSVTVGGSEPVGEMNVTVNGTEVPIATTG